MFPLRANLNPKVDKKRSAEPKTNIGSPFWKSDDWSLLARKVKLAQLNDDSVASMGSRHAKPHPRVPHLTNQCAVPRSWWTVCHYAACIEYPFECLRHRKDLPAHELIIEERLFETSNLSAPFIHCPTTSAVVVSMMWFFGRASLGSFATGRAVYDEGVGHTVCNMAEDERWLHYDNWKQTVRMPSWVTVNQPSKFTVGCSVKQNSWATGPESAATE